MLISLNRFAMLAACLVSAPAAALLPTPDPTTLDTPFAVESTNYNDPSGVGPGGIAYNSHFGVGTAQSSYSVIVNPPSNPPTFTPHVAVTASISIAGYPYLALSATNPTNPAGSAYAHAELRYQYLLTVAKPANANPTLGYTFANAATITGVSHIHSGGLSTSLSLTASAPGNVSFDPITAGIAHGSSDVAYDNDDAFTFFAPGQYVGTTNVGGIDYLNYKGTLSLYATVFGVTNSQTIFVDGAPMTVTVNNHPGATATASLDPLIGINPAFLSQYGLSGGTVTLSPGVANASAPAPGVPEPSSWILLIAGFGLTGAAVRHRRAAISRN